MHALIIARLDYCNSLYINLPLTLIDRLQRVMRAAARVIVLPTKRASLTAVCKYLHWLPVLQRVQFKVLTLVFKALNGMAPQYLEELCTEYHPTRTLRSSQSNLLVVPKCRVKYGERSFSYAGPKLWNALPGDIRDSTSLTDFKQRLKTFLFKFAYEV